MATQLIKASNELATMSVEELMNYGQSMVSPDAVDLVSPRLKIPKEFDGDIKIGDTRHPGGIEAVIVATIKAKQYYVKKNSSIDVAADSMDGLAPACSSIGGNYGNVLGTMDEERMNRFQKSHPDHPYFTTGGMNHSCHECPLSQYQAGGSPCMQRQNVILMVRGYSLPVLTSLPRMSINNFNSYVSSLVVGGTPYFSVWTKITHSEKRSGGGNKYCVLDYERKDDVNRETELPRIISWMQEAEEAWRNLAVKPEVEAEAIPERFVAPEGVPVAGRTVDAKTGEVISAEEIPF